MHPEAGGPLVAAIGIFSLRNEREADGKPTLSHSRPEMPQKCTDRIEVPLCSWNPTHPQEDKSKTAFDPRRMTLLP